MAGYQDFSEVNNCRSFIMATASCYSSDFIVRGIASYVKDITFGRNLYGPRGVFVRREVHVNKKQMIKADGKLEEFCKACVYDEALQFVPEISTCGQVANIYDIKQEDQDNLDTLPALGLGRGWSDDKQMATFIECFEGTEKFHGGSKAVTLLNTASSFEVIQRGLAASAKAKAGAKSFSGSAESAYAEFIKDTQYTKSFYFLQSVELPTAVFQPKGYGVKGLSEYGKDAYDAGPEQFRKICGNRLITEIHQGAALYATMQIRFNSNDYKKIFEAHYKASFGGMASVKTSIQTTVQTYKINGELRVTAHQIGGDSSQLTKVFGQCGKSYCITVCSLDNLDACDGIIAGILSYAQNEFPEQIDFRNGVVFGSASPISYTMPKLSDVVGLAISDSVVTDAIATTRKFFKALYANQTKILDFVKHALDLPEEHHIPGEIALQNLKLADSALKNNMALIESAALDCYSEPSECEALEQTIAWKLTNVTLVLD